MANSTPENKRRRGDDGDDQKPRSKQKTKHANTSRTTTPPTARMTSVTAGATTSSPPPVRHHPNPKVTASATKGIPPPPMVGGDDVDLVPPEMTSPTLQQSKASSNSLKSGQRKEQNKRSKTQNGKIFEEEENKEEDEIVLEAGTNTAGAQFSWLYAILLLLVAGSAGLVHQRIVQELHTQCKGHKRNYEYAQKQLNWVVEERNLVKNDLESVSADYFDLIHEIQATSRQQLISRFGTGPYYEVELELHFAEDEPEQFNYMTVELDGENMPHTVLTFLTQIDHGLYNTGGFAFHHNGDHIVFGSPIANHLNFDEEDTWERWQFSGVSQLTYQEYTERVPHLPYTIGFSQRGPNLYFNVLDNTLAHGEIRDPCFGKVTRGWELVDRMHMASGELGTGDWKPLEPGYVAIRSAFILSRE
eukprot:scaffold713_cov131-Cylindrotheca_fusiformis.AAC.3